MGVGSDAVRKRIAAGTVRARKRGSRWEVWLPLEEATAGGGDAPPTPATAPSGIPEGLALRNSGRQDAPSGAPDRPSGAPETGDDELAKLGAGLVALLEKLQEENRNLAGQVGFLQAQRQLLEERVRLLEAPRDELEAELRAVRAERDGARTEAEAARRETDETVRLAEEAARLREAPPAGSRPWWRFW